MHIYKLLQINKHHQASEIVMVARIPCSTGSILPKLPAVEQDFINFHADFGIVGRLHLPFECSFSVAYS